MNNILARVRSTENLKISMFNEDSRRLIIKENKDTIGSDAEGIGIAKDTGFELQNNIFSEKEFKPDHIFKFPLPKPHYTTK